MLDIKLKGMEHRAPCKHKFCPYTISTCGVGSKGQNILFLNVFMLHFKLKGKKYRPTLEEKTLTLHTPLTLGQIERTDIEIVQINIFCIEVSAKIVDRLFILICVVVKGLYIPKLNLGVGEMRFYVL